MGLSAATVDAFDLRLRILPGTANADDIVTLIDNSGTVVTTLLPVFSEFLLSRWAGYLFFQFWQHWSC